ncbi:MAG: hypothetical protein IT559_07435 [Alphaproteobacteria bacterium]|nr:hypothetical protein [Alphaproteobacteria bacterium]
MRRSNRMNKQICQNRGRERESGNVLFLILIAVALFAALSYAVTQSSRSGGGDANSEKSLVNSAQITQYPASVRTSLVRMMVSNGTSADIMNFDPPTDFATTCTASPAPCVFHPSGGGATYVTAPAEVMASAAQGTWYFSSTYQVQDIGTTVASNAGNEIIAFLVGVSPSVCKKLNTQLGIGATDDTDANGVGDAGIAVANIPTSAMGQISGNLGIDGYVAAQVIDGPDFAGQPFGCVDFDDATNDTNSSTADGALVYYHVLIER